MQGYDRSTVDDMDDYEESCEEEGQEEDEYEEEEPPKPTKEELEYLELRQRLKEGFRQQLKIDGNSAHNGYKDKRNKLPYDDFGSFFGPSQPVIAPRVIQDSKSLLETRQLASKILNPHQSNRKSFPNVASGAKNGVHEPKVNESKTKVQTIRDARDYSFLLSDDGPQGPTKESRDQNVNINSVVKSSPALLKGKQSSGVSGKQFTSRQEVRKPASMNPPKQIKSGMSGVATGMKSNSTSARNPNPVSVNSRKPPIQNSRSGSDQPSKVTGGVMKKPAMAGLKNAMPTSHNSSQLKVPASVPKQRLKPKESLKPKMNKEALKQPVAPSKTVMSKSSKPISSSLKKKPAQPYSDEDDDEDTHALSMIRQMFRYNPDKYAGRDDDDSDMEANFDDIMREEKRSTRIAKREDEEELRKIEEEERRERMRMAEKRRKLNNR